MSKDAERLLADNELGVNKDSVEFLQLYRELLKAQVKLTKLLKQREMGNHEAEKALQITPPFLLGLHQLRKSKKTSHSGGRSNAMPECQFDNMEHSNQSDRLPRLELSEFPFQAMTAATLFDLASGRKCRVLEAGSGPKAPVSSTLAHCENLDLVCCDKMQPESGLDFAEFIVVDLIQNLPFKDESFDFITCTEVLEHLKNPFCVIEELVRILRPEGFLLLSIPNFWNVRGRLRYFVMANLQKSQFLVERSRQDFRQNLCPHINTTTLPVYEYGLASLGMKISAACVAVRRPGNWLYWPFALFIMFLSALRSRQKKERYLLDHANHPRILMGGEHIMFVCQKVGFDNVPYEVARWEFLGNPSNI